MNCHLEGWQPLVGTHGSVSIRIVADSQAWSSCGEVS
jgi:hypothetical protein